MKFKHVSVAPCKHLDYKHRVRWRDADGRERSKWFKTSADATALARKVENELRGGQPGIGSLSEEETLAVRRLRSFRAGHDSPPSVLAVVETGIAAGAQPLPDLSVAELVVARIAAVGTAGAGARHLTDVRRDLERFAGDFGERLASSLSAEELEQWCAARDVGNQTFNHYRSRLFAAFNMALVRGWVRVNPLARVARRKVRRAEPEILTPPELGALLNHASDRIRPLLILQAFCGLRRAEAERLHWKHVHLSDGADEGHVEVPVKVAKTARRRLGHLSGNARLWLQPLAGKPDAPLGLHIEVYRRDLARAWKLAAPGKQWSANCLRHSFGTYHIASHRDEARTAAIMGNSVQMVRCHYLALTTPAAAAAYWAIKPAGLAALAADHGGEERRRRVLEAIRNADPEAVRACERLLEPRDESGIVVPFSARSA